MFLQLFMLRTLGPYLIQLENEFNVLFFSWGTHLNTWLFFFSFKARENEFICVNVTVQLESHKYSRNLVFDNF